MAYRIDFHHDLPHEVRRIAARQLASASELLTAQPDGVHEAVHGARKAIKRVRALYRLVGSEAKKFARSEDDRLRDIAGSLTHLRDATANFEAARFLRSRSESEEEAAAISRITETLDSERVRIARDRALIDATIAAALSGLGEARKALSELNLPGARGKAASCLADGWRKVDRRAVKALQACAGSSDDEPFHALRKRSQDRWMHATLLHALWPAGMNSIANEAKALVDIVGHEHDLAMLHDEIAGHADFRNTDEDKKTVLAAIHRERLRLQEASRQAGRQLFDRKPDRDAEILELLIRQK